MKTIYIIEPGDIALLNGERFEFRDQIELDQTGVVRKANEELASVDQVKLYNSAGHETISTGLIASALRGELSEDVFRFLNPGDFGYLEGEPIHAEIFDNSHKFGVQFDARAWFEQAGDQDITDLHECGYRGDYAADDVGEFYERPNLAISKLFASKGEDGFEVVVNEDDAHKWLLQNRPELAEKLKIEVAA